MRSEGLGWGLKEMRRGRADAKQVEIEAMAGSWIVGI